MTRILGALLDLKKALTETNAPPGDWSLQVSREWLAAVQGELPDVARLTVPGRRGKIEVFGIKLEVVK